MVLPAPERRLQTMTRAAVTKRFKRHRTPSRIAAHRDALDIRDPERPVVDPYSFDDAMIGKGVNGLPAVVCLDHESPKEEVKSDQAHETDGNQGRVFAGFYY